MNDIKVGDRVHDFCYGNGTALALHLAAGGECWVWSEYDKPKTCYGTRITDLTRIEPEKVVLTPRFAVGQRLRLRGDHSHIFIADRIEILYQDSGNPMQSWYEDALEPVPEPCPECKGSGIASEGGA